MTQNDTSGSQKPRSIISRYWRGNLFFAVYAAVLVLLMSVLKQPELSTAISAYVLILVLAALVQLIWYFVWEVKGYRMVAEYRRAQFERWVTEQSENLNEWMRLYRRVLIVIGFALWLFVVSCITALSDAVIFVGGVAIALAGVVVVWTTLLVINHHREHRNKADKDATEENKISSIDPAQETTAPEVEAEAFDLDSLPPEEFDARIDSMEGAEVISLAARRELKAERLRAHNEQIKTETSHMILWKENPHPKWLWKRMWWRLPLATIIAGMLIAGISSANLAPQLDGSVPLIGVSIVILAWLWYLIRRYLKWKYLFLTVQGARFIVQEARIPWFGLKGTTQSASVLSCGDISESQTQFESWGWFDSGKLSIDTSIENKQGQNAGGDSGGGKPSPDLVFNLKDVRKHLKLKLLIEDIHDELFTGRTSQELAKRRKIASM